MTGLSHNFHGKQWHPCSKMIMSIEWDVKILCCAYVLVVGNLQTGVISFITFFLGDHSWQSSLWPGLVFKQSHTHLVSKTLFLRDKTIDTALTQIRRSFWWWDLVTPNPMRYFCYACAKPAACLGVWADKKPGVYNQACERIAWRGISSISTTSQRKSAGLSRRRCRNR